MTTAKTSAAPHSTVDAYKNKITAQVQEAKARLEQYEAKAKGKAADAEIAAITSLNLAKKDIDRKLQDLKATHDVYQAHARADIDADVERFKASVDELSRKLKSQPTKK